METRQQPCVASSVINGIKADRKRPHGNLCTEDGSLDRYARPAIKGRTGGWRCAMFILVNQGLVTLAFAAVEGLIALSLVTQLSLLKPQGCGKLGQLCEPHSSAETAVFYVAIYLIALGNGAPEPALAAFGADQFDEEDSTEKQSKNSFYSYFYVALNMGSLVAETVLVYIQNLGNWILGFWICAACAALAFCLLLCGTFQYRHFKAVGNSISKFSQVIVASMRKMNFQVPSNGEGLYEIERKQGKNNGVRRILHTNGFKYLDRAAIITPVDMVEPANPWHLCTITQVEEVKSILRLLPIWFCTVLSSVVFIQMLSLFVEQGAAMDTTTISNFHIPPASMFAFDIISTSTFILLYDKLIVPLYIKVTKREPKPPSELQRIGIGIAMAMATMIIAAIVEQQRLKHADSKNTSDLSIFWQIPQYVLVGVSEASVNGEAGWVPPDLDDGHLDRYFFLLAALTAINLVLFVICAKRYNPISFENRAEDMEMGTQEPANEA
ncbi:hypothetical protein PVK06_028083 [Gossypium arboreum]|uniref:Protein NRT1/ PTR FAMILY 7.3-like n=1 Tax=Gossypium arboreum TaxID=29729 RepID=A0ABR0P1Z1_GOSAR|nr:hypothetical protein PVK06_028083 [Gossypium arboreum]